LGRSWGRETRIPTKKAWVGYSDQLQTRIIIDYEKGEVAVETLRKDLTEAQLRAEILRLHPADSDLFDDRDELAKRLKTKTDKAGLDSPPPRRQDKRQRELGDLVDPARPGAYTVVPGVGPQGQPLEVKRLTVPFNAGAERLNAERLRQPVTAYADHYKLPRSLVLSIIKNESSFNPRAQSPVPAFGLMQLVPTSGGKDAYSLVVGKKAMPTPDYLFRPVENIELGAAYLHILNYKYLDGIQNTRSRTFAVISAYNTGAGNVARALVGRNAVDAAEAAANRMTPDQVYDKLIRDLPYDETRQYLRKVSRDMETFKDWDAGRG